MSFDLGEVPKTNGGEMYYQKTHVEQTVEEYQSTIGVHKDLFETISEAHYLPDLSGPHDEALLESLVEKGCEDNHILGQALDKLAHLVNGSGDYVEEEDDLLLSGAPVSDIINRLEQLESPGRNSITAAQSLLHLHQLGDHLDVPDHQHSINEPYINNDVYDPDNPTESNEESHETTTQIQINNLSYETEPEKRLKNELIITNLDYATEVPEKHNEHDDHQDDEQSTFPDQSNIAVSNDSYKNDLSEGENHEQTDERIDDQTQHDGEQEEFVPQDDISTEVLTEVKQEEDVPTNLSFKRKDDDVEIIENTMATTDESVNNNIVDDISDKMDEIPKDFSGYRRLVTPHPHESPKRLEIPRAPSRESDAMQSPQPSGIPAVPSSPELFSVPQVKSKHSLFLETLLSSPSPKMYTSEVTITKHQCEPINLGKHRKSASPTVTSCSDDRRLNKEFGEPHEKRPRSQSTEELAKISKVCIPKTSDDSISGSRIKKSDLHKYDENSPIKQLQALKTSPDFNIPDPLLVPKNKLNAILAAPAREIPALLIERPELRLPEAFAYPHVLQDPDILVVAWKQLEEIIENNPKIIEQDDKLSPSPTPKPSSTKPSENQHTKPAMPSMDALAGDIDAATSDVLNQMQWIPYFREMEACYQNIDFLKAMNSSGYPTNYPDNIPQIFNYPSRFMNSSGFPMMPPMDYGTQMRFAMWQEAMNVQRSKNHTEQSKETAKSSDVQSAHVHSTKNHQNRTHSSARTSPIAHNYNNFQRGSMPHNSFLQGLYPAMNPNLRSNMPLPGLQIPYFNPNVMNSQRSPRSTQQKSPTSPYYPNNNYLQSLKHDGNRQRTNSSSSSQESPRPRITVKSLQNLIDPAAAAASGSRRASSSSTGRRREETEVGSTTPLGETPPQLPPQPHDPIHHLWHPLFGNQKNYNSPWSWTTVTATGD